MNADDPENPPATFGRQRSATDYASLALLLLGFVALAVAFWVFTASWLGVLLPIGFVIGAYATLRIEVREIEIRAEEMIIRTFFRGYKIPRGHITNVALTPDGAAIDVLNGTRYFVTPPGVDATELARTLRQWHGGAGASSVRSE